MAEKIDLERELVDDTIILSEPPPLVPGECHDCFFGICCVCDLLLCCRCCGGKKKKEGIEEPLLDEDPIVEVVPVIEKPVVEVPLQPKLNMCYLMTFALVCALSAMQTGSAMIDSTPLLVIVKA